MRLLDAPTSKISGRSGQRAAASHARSNSCTRKKKRSSAFAAIPVCSDTPPRILSSRHVRSTCHDCPSSWNCISRMLLPSAVFGIVRQQAVQRRKEEAIMRVLLRSPAVAALAAVWLFSVPAVNAQEQSPPAQSPSSGASDPAPKQRPSPIRVSRSTNTRRS
jgi:hypothetical protein